VARFDDELWELVPEHHGHHPPHLTEFVRELPDVAEALDLGCGDGQLGSLLRARRVVGADVSSVPLDRARPRLAEVMLVAPDEPLPFEDGSFDLVLLAEMLEHVRDVQLLLSEVRRVLRPAGRLAISTPAHTRLSALRILVRGWESEFQPLSPHLRFFTRRSLAQLLDDMGFDVVSLRRRAGSLLALASRP
jgi:SAM-dependent methyltransferase